MNFVTKTLVSVFALAMINGCASQPDELQRAYVSPTQFGSFNCSQLGGELERVSGRKVELYGQLKKTADDDAAQMGVGLILLWPTLFFLEGGDGPQAAEYSRLLGEHDAIEKTMIRKDCNAELIKVKQSAPSTQDTEARLNKIQKLLDDGVITQQEFDAQRKKVLAQI